MNLYSYFREEILKALQSLVQEGYLSSDLDLSRVTADPPREASHGDIATNAAMILAKPAQLAPRVLAERLIDHLKNHPDIRDCSVAGPGFINFHLKPSFWIHCLKDILKAQVHYGDSSLGAQVAVNVEYVSANPTGPLHIGHCRGAIVGDVLAALLEKAGYKVTREYYINDAGGQANDLARSAYQRYLEALGHPSQEKGSYQGGYLIPVGKSLAEAFGDKWIQSPESDWIASIRAFAIKEMMKLIEQDLALLGIHHDVFTSELELVEKGKVDEALETLKSMGLIYEGVLEPPKGKVIEDYEARQQILFKSTESGDDIDRPLQKSDGTWTYFASDIAYHYDKFRRGSQLLVNIWGADHGGYVKRLSTAVQAITQNQAQVQVHLCQMVRFLENGQVLKMSKREGNFVTVVDALEKVGVDAIRFMMVWRKNDAALDFDFNKVVEQSRDNPVFYVQYAYARCCSVQRHLKNTFPSLSLEASTLSNLDLETFKDETELALVKLLVSWPRHVETAATVQEPHRIAYYLYDLASAFHALWTKGKETTELRFIFPENPEESQKRFALVKAVMFVLESGFKILGVTPREEMHT